MDKFVEGYKFSSFKELKNALLQYKRETNVQFYFKNCFPLNKAACAGVKNASRGKESLRYYRVRLRCKEYRPNSYPERSRNGGCQAYILLLLTKCGNFLEIVHMDLTHNHKISSNRALLIAERRRERFVKTRKIPHEEAHMIVDRHSEEVLKKETHERRLLYVSSSEESDEKSEHTFRGEGDEKSEHSFRGEGDEKIRHSFSEESYKKNDHSLSEESDKESEHSFSEEIDKKSEHSFSEEIDKKSEHSFSEEIDKKSERPFSEESNKICKSNSFSEDNSNSISNDFKADSHKMPPIYTKCGDFGITCTFNGEEKSKDHNIFEAVGTTEELSNSIGFAIEFLPKSCDPIITQLRQIQCILQDLIVHLGTPQFSDTDMEEDSFEFPEIHLVTLEKWIDDHTQNIPQTKSIILPSGGQGSCSLHVARTICRRAERRIVSLIKNYAINKTALQYLNRLGDYLFVVARRVSLVCRVTEHSYKEPEREPHEYKIVYLSHPA